VFEVVVVCCVCPGHVLDPWLAAPHHRPVFAFAGSENVVVLSMHSVKAEVCFLLAHLRIRMHLFDKWPARKISVHDQLKDVIVEISFVEIPEIVVRLVKKIESVESLDPAHTNAHVFIVPIDLRSAASDCVLQLIHADNVFLGNHLPVIRFAIDAGNRIGRKLKDLEFNAQSFDSIGLRCRQRQQKDSGTKTRFLQHSFLSTSAHTVSSPMIRKLSRGGEETPTKDSHEAVSTLEACRPHRADWSTNLTW